MKNRVKSSKLLNIKRLAERLEVSPRTIHNWLRAGTMPIPHIEGMKPPKWRAADVDAWLNERTR